MKMFQWTHQSLRIAFTNAKAKEETCVRFPKPFPDSKISNPEDLLPGFRGRTLVKLKFEKESVLQQISAQVMV